MTYFKLIFVLPVYLIFNTTIFAQTKINTIQAKIFYNENKGWEDSKNVSGTFSENVIDTDFAFWNTIIGGGSAEGYSNQTIVIVEVISNNSPNKNKTLKFTATAGKKILQQQQRHFSCIGDNTKYKLLFLLNETGCEEIEIKADIIEKGKSISTMKKTIGFKCGE